MFCHNPGSGGVPDLKVSAFAGSSCVGPGSPSCEGFGTPGADLLDLVPGYTCGPALSITWNVTVTDCPAYNSVGFISFTVTA